MTDRIVLEDPSLRQLARELADRVSTHLKRKRYAGVMEIAREIRQGMTEPLSSADHSELYNEDGLPK